jgi:hypothetical protein
MMLTLYSMHAQLIAVTRLPVCQIGRKLFMVEFRHEIEENAYNLCLGPEGLDSLRI